MENAKRETMKRKRFSIKITKIVNFENTNSVLADFFFKGLSLVKFTAQTTTAFKMLHKAKEISSG